MDVHNKWTIVFGQRFLLSLNYIFIFEIIINCKHKVFLKI